MWPMTRLPSLGCVYMLCTMVFIQWLPLHTHGSCRDPLMAAAVTPTGARKKDAARPAVHCTVHTVQVCRTRWGKLLDTLLRYL